MKRVNITCDGCSADLTWTGNCVDYRLELSSENIQSRGGFVTAMGKTPPVDRSYHFCGLKCLDHWRSHENAFSAAMEKHWDKWKSEHGTKDENGRIRSYRTPDDTVYDEWKRLSRADAATAYPLQRCK